MDDKKVINNNSFGKRTKVIEGKSVTDGFAIGKIVLVENEIKIKNEKIFNIDEEIKKFDEAYNNVILDMDNSINNANENVAEIIEARKMILCDDNYINEIKNKIKEGFSAEYSISIIAKDKKDEFEKLDNEYLKERISDIKDISNKLILALNDKDNKMFFDEPTIVVSEEITPEDISASNKNNIVGFVAKNGSMMSHASIVASNIGVPYIFGIDYNIDEIKNSLYAIVDAKKATLILNPDNNMIAEFENRKEEEIKANSKNNIEDIDKKLKDVGIDVYANIANPEDVDLAIENGSFGIGLYRTEFLYMKNDKVPSEDEQFEAYKKVVSKMGNKEVIIRTMDIGADKKAKCLNLPNEENPALGKRAIRICLEDTELFRTQLRALLRAAIYGNEKIMFPMITSKKEIEEIRQQIKISEKELIERGENYKIPPIGIMVETPAAAIKSSELAKEVDFFSIGTNDLTQYTLAVDRTGKNLDRYYKADDEAVMSLIKMTVDGAKEAGIPVGICGEIAGDINIVEKLVKIGVKEFSMAPSKIFKIKQKIVDCVENEKEKEMLDETFVAPVDGEIIPMEEIPDEAFSSGGLGQCIGIIPENGYIYSPCDGKIVSIAKTKHAICITTYSGKEILIHIGIDTVELKGNGFELKVKEGENVKKGKLLVDVDLNIIKNANLSPIVIVAVTKM